MTTLGIGTRVWIGWAPDRQCAPKAKHARCQKGTISYGPLLPGEIIYDGPAVCMYVRLRSWWVRPDSMNDEIGVAEYLLTPIDDGETEADRARGMAVET